MTVFDVISPENLYRMPSLSDETYIWTDYCELICLCNPTKEISIEDIVKEYMQFQDLTPEDTDNENNDQRYQNKLSRKREQAVSVLSDAFAMMQFRKDILREKYPFTIDDYNQILMPSKAITDASEIYVILLLASHLNYVTDLQIRNNLTSDFEVISLSVMRKIYPQADVKLFGSGNSNKSLKPSDRYSKTKLKDRILELANKINTPATEHINSIPDNNTGDGGIDIVGIINLNDKRSSVPIFFAQCACSKDKWKLKQDSTALEKWSKWIELWQNSIQRCVFIPFSYANSTSEWVNVTDITQNVVIDRYRIMSFIEKNTKIYFETLAD